MKIDIKKVKLPKLQEGINTEPEKKATETSPDYEDLQVWAKEDIEKLKKFKLPVAQAKYNYYASKLAGNLDKKVLESFKKGMPVRVDDIRRYSDEFAKKNTKFKVSQDKFAEILGGEEALKDFYEARKIVSETYNLPVEGTDEDALDFGARHVSLIQGAKGEITTDTDLSNKTPDFARKVRYDVQFDPEKGIYGVPESMEKGVKYKRPYIKPTPTQETPELKNGLDFSSKANYNKWLSYGHASGEFDRTSGNQSVSIKGEKKKVKHLSKLEDGVDTTKNPISDKAISGATAGLGVAGDIVNTFDTQEEGKKSVAGSALSGVASGAGAGFAVGGPIGAAIGGGVMGAVGVVGSIMGNKAAERKAERLRLEAERKEALSHFAPAQNTQTAMYEFGTSGANMTKPVEVEKDEVVLRKNALGKFTLKADFKGGKSHSKGGEDYVLEQGDIVFPGSKRSSIMKSLKSGNHTKIESERLRLPKDLPTETQKLKVGIDYTNQITKPDTPVTPYWLQQPTYQTKSYGDEIPTPRDITKEPSKILEPEDERKEKNQKDKPDKTPTDWSSLLQYTPAISNVIKGFQTPEKVDREYYKPETYKYKDLSESLRRESDLQAEVDKENAARFSGGSAQVARAGKAMASAARFRRLQAIDVQEQQRADSINSANIGIRNQAKGTNIELKSKYDELDAQNKAAVDAYFDQGVSDFGRITNQINRDKQMSKMQDIMLKNIDTDNYYYDPITGERKFKQETVSTPTVTETETVTETPVKREKRNKPIISFRRKERK